MVLGWDCLAEDPVDDYCTPQEPLLLLCFPCEWIFDSPSARLSSPFLTLARDETWWQAER